LVASRVRAALVEHRTGDGTAAGRAGVAGHHVLTVGVGEEGRGRGAWIAVQVLAHVQVGRVELSRSTRALVARPPEVLDRRARRARDAVDLLVGAPADITHPQLIGAGPYGEPERVAHPVGDDAPRVRVGVSRRRVVGL